MHKILQYFFKKRNKKITYGGKSLIYDRDGQKYFIKSEFLIGKPNIIVYWDKMYPILNKDAIMEKELKKEIASEIKVELQQEGLSVELHPYL